MVAILYKQTQNAIWLLYYINKHRMRYGCYIIYVNKHKTRYGCYIINKHKTRYGCYII